MAEKPAASKSTNDKDLDDLLDSKYSGRNHCAIEQLHT